MKARRFFGCLTVAAIVALLAPSALAGCIPPKTFSTWNALQGVYKYIYFGDASGDSSHLVGSFWQTDNPATNNQAYAVQEWLLDNYYFPMQDSWYLNGNLGAAEPDCIFGHMTLEASNTVTGGSFMTAVTETPGAFVDYDFSIFANIDTRGQVTQPRINSSSRNVDIVTLNVTVDPTVVGGEATVDNTEILVQIGPDGVPPAGRDPEVGWSTIGSTGGNGGTIDVDVDCSGVAPGDNAFIGVAYLSGGGRGEVSGFLSEVECDPNLADPGDRFRLIDRDAIRKGKGAKRDR